MIDVPERVKDSLRDGMMPKEFRFDVFKTVDVYIYTDITTLTNGTAFSFTGSLFIS